MKTRRKNSPDGENKRREERVSNHIGCDSTKRSAPWFKLCTTIGPDRASDLHALSGISRHTSLLHNRLHLDPNDLRAELEPLSSSPTWNRESPHLDTREHPQHRLASETSLRVYADQTFTCGAHQPHNPHLLSERLNEDPLFHGGYDMTDSQLNPSGFLTQNRK